MSPFQVIVLATPVFLLLIALEFAWGWSRQRRGKGRNTYALSDTLNSISLGVLSQLSGVFTQLLTVGIYSLVQAELALWHHDSFWLSPLGFVVALIFYDFCYYWLHRAGHRSGILWAAHVVHHQSEHYNLSTALRQTSSGSLLGWVFYLPMALAGVPPLVFGIVALVDLLYQFWVHTEQVGKLGWFDRVFCSPSNHRVHHAVNEHYLDRNYGGVLVIWDRLFGTFAEENEPCVYGTRSPLRSWDPLWANAQVYWSLLQASWRARGWGNKLAVWLMPPGWQPPGQNLYAHVNAFNLQAPRFNPPLAAAVQWFAALQFLLLLQGVALVLWFARDWPLQDVTLWSAALVVCYWSLGALLQGRVGIGLVLMTNSAALATVCAALNLHTAFLLLKPAPMVIAMILVALKLYASRDGFGFYLKLLAAVSASLAGDVLLMLPGDHFIAGLAAFLGAHLAYLAMLRQDVPWLPRPVALLATGGVGALMYALLWPGLTEPALKGAVAVYVMVIALMTAQAIGRASRLGSRSAHTVAWGAGIFMLSDALLAFDRFVQPLPLASLWVLSSYFMAQALIVHNARPGLAANPA
jgi:alkylglycerol monooxygenase